MRIIRTNSWRALALVTALAVPNALMAQGVWNNICNGGANNGKSCVDDTDCPGNPPGTCETEGIATPLVTVHMAYLHTGKILTWANTTNDPNGPTTARVWNFWDLETDDYTADAFVHEDGNGMPFHPAWTNVFNTNTDLFCVGHSALADGRIITTGGDVVSVTVGLPDTNMFDPGLFDPLDPNLVGWLGQVPGTILPPPMEFPRWYPTSTTLATGDVLTVSGSHSVCVGGSRDTFTCHQDDDDADTGCPDGGMCTFFYQPLPELYFPDADDYETLGSASLTIPFYPFMFVLPNGKVFYAGSEDAGGLFNAARQGRTLDLGTRTWDPELYTSTKPGGSAVMYEPGRF